MQTVFSWLLKSRLSRNLANILRAVWANGGSCCLTPVRVVVLHPDGCKTLFPTCDECSRVSPSVCSACACTDNAPSLSQRTSPASFISRPLILRISCVA